MNSDLYGGKLLDRSPVGEQLFDSTCNSGGGCDFVSWSKPGCQGTPRVINHQTESTVGAQRRLTADQKSEMKSAAGGDGDGTAHEQWQRLSGTKDSISKHVWLG